MQRTKTQCDKRKTDAQRNSTPCSRLLLRTSPARWCAPVCGWSKTKPYVDLAIASPYEQLAGASGARNCAVACEVNERAKLERVCRYMARGPISQERLRVLAIDLSRRPLCGAELHVIAALTDPGVIARLLEPVGLEGRVQPGAPPSPVTN